ncbi:MAG: LPS export ABC transporter periplasmic protein LptC [Gammaproteobacteria bacterium]|nr:LPS export ABC transporter periplasmic protein LptC [Gammaproteobacteria bacterium]
MRNLIYFIVLSAAVAASWWLARSLSQDDVIGKSDRSEPKRGFYLRGAVLYGTSEDGSPRYTLKANRIDQNIAEDRFDATTIQLKLNDPDGPPWLVQADQGMIPSDQAFIQLNGSVRARRDQPDPTFSLESESMRLLNEERVAQTSDAVIIRYGQQQLTAVGMRAYFNEDRVELQSMVHGDFIP